MLVRYCPGLGELVAPIEGSLAALAEDAFRHDVALFEEIVDAARHRAIFAQSGSAWQWPTWQRIGMM
jgi:hypothetical protein